MAIREQYIRGLLGKMAFVMEEWQKLEEGGESIDTQKLFFLVHNLSASASMHELQGIALQAKKLETSIRQQDFLSIKTLDVLGSLCQEVCTAQKQLNLNNNNNFEVSDVSLS